MPALKAGATFPLNSNTERQMAVPDVLEILPLENVIQNAITSAINHSGGKVVEASAKLGVSASTLHRRLKV